MKINRDKVDKALALLISTSTGKKVGLSDAPVGLTDEDRRDNGYIVVYQSPSPKPDGSWGDPEDCRYLDYQVKSVGRSHLQCAWISSKVQSILTDRAAGDPQGYATPFAVSGLAIIDRATISNGIIRKSGERLFETDDIYRLVVTAG